jgi:methanogenic corrinoid protein MtbC1
LALSGDSLPGQFYEALRSGDAQAALGCISGLFLNGLSIAAICDGSIQPAMHRLGELWREDPRGILVEHRATDICVSALGVLRQMIGDPPKNAPIALGGAPQGDPYLLPSMIAGAVFAETGYRDMNFGPDTPLDLLATAAEEKKPRIVWLSIKSAGDRAKIRTQVGELAERLAGMGINLVIGGSAVESLNLRSGRNIHIMQTMTELGAFARGASGVTTQPNPDSEK